jgi:hypothetical protein
LSMRTPSRPDRSSWRWWIWHEVVPTSGLTCADQRHPGSSSPRPMARLPTRSRLPKPFGNSRLSSGSSRFLRRITPIARQSSARRAAVKPRPD